MKSSQSIQEHRSEVDATFQVVKDAAGRPIFHLSTYGSDQRKSEPKVSQTIQVDEIIGRRLIRELTLAFGSHGSGLAREEEKS